MVDDYGALRDRSCHVGKFVLLIEVQPRVEAETHLR
jgi:hypothetical protein